jgi:hypothetical protein
MPAPNSPRGPLDEESLHSLLAGGKLSGAQRERALEGALQQRRHGGGRVVGMLAVVLPAAAALMLFVLGPPAPSTGKESRGTFIAKGEAGPLLTARCPDRAAGECRSGDRLIFEVQGATDPGFFAAYADCRARERIWYFPTANGDMPHVSPGAERSILEQAARLGPEHGEGPCTLELFLLPKPASRVTVSGLGRTMGGAHSELVIDIER